MFVWASLALWLPFALPHSQAQTLSRKAWSLQEVLQVAVQNWDVRMAQRNVDAAQADVVAADHAPNPVLSSSLSSIDLQNGSGEGSWLNERRVDKSIGIDWTWERGNKRAFRTQAATEGFKASRADWSATRIQQMLAAQAAFFDLLAAQERQQQLDAIAQSARQAAQSAQRRLEAGDLSAQEASRSAIEAERARGDAEQARLDSARAQSNLAAFIQLSAPDSADLQVVAPQPLDAQALNQAVNQSVNQANGPSQEDWIEQWPEVQAAQARLASAQASVEAAGALQKSDVTLGTAWDHYPGVSNSLLQIRMQMPLQFGALGAYTHQGEIAKAQANWAQAQDQLNKTRQLAQLEQQRMRRELDSAQRRLNIYQQDIGPRAQQVLQQAEWAYARGAIPLSDLLDSRRTWRASSLEAIAAQADWNKAAHAWRLRTRLGALDDKPLPPAQ